MIRVVLIEDQAMVRGALAALLTLERDMQVVGEAGTGDEGLALARALTPDVVITDIEMPGGSGLDVAAALRTHRPPIRVVVLTTFARSGYLRRAMEAGASGYLLKDAPSGQLADAVRRVAQGGRVIDPNLAAEAWADADPLTERERTVLRYAAEGLTSAEIAEQMGIADGTVRNYLSEAIGKLGARNRLEAVNLARTQGWL